MRLVIVSNRLPFTVISKGRKLEFQKSVGGLSTGLSAYLESTERQDSGISEKLWIGWPGGEGLKRKKEIIQRFSSVDAYPVFLPPKSVEKFYHGFCNKTIWPLFHFFPGYTIFDESFWEQYQQINEIFAEAIVSQLRHDDLVWVHDYHLMLVPQMIRNRAPNANIGFFLHIPFPSFEIFRLLPVKWRRAILEGLLGADLIGFHTYDYTHAFLRCVLRILGLEHQLGKISIDDRVSHVDTFPMGIDFDRFHQATMSGEVEAERRRLRHAFGQAKIVVSIDRLDYTKGILQRLLGYERFLEKNPHWHKKVVLMLVLVPSRTRVELYQQMKQQIDECIGRINGRFDSLGWNPIFYQYRSKPFSSLVALYAGSEIALITPLRDGMNLVSKEYLACRTDGTGVLILSEMAGAAQELGEALVINPNSVDEIAEAIQAALEMPKEKQIWRNRIMQKRLKQYTVLRWAEDFIRQCIEIRSEPKESTTEALDSKARAQLLNDYRRAKRRILFLDYDETLASPQPYQDRAQPDPTLLVLLKRLSKTPSNQVVLTSGYSRDILEKWFTQIPVYLIAENGAWLRNRDQQWRQLKALKNDWKTQILPLLQIYCDRLPGSFVEEKEFALVWDYRAATPELASFREKELLDELVQLTGNFDVQVMRRNKVLEIQSSGISKTEGVLTLLNERKNDFILVIGNKSMDDDFFRAMPSKAYTIRVGRALSSAQYHLPHSDAVRQLLRALVK